MEGIQSLIEKRTVKGDRYFQNMIAIKFHLFHKCSAFYCSTVGPTYLMNSSLSLHAPA